MTRRAPGWVALLALLVAGARAPPRADVARPDLVRAMETRGAAAQTAERAARLREAAAQARAEQLRAARIAAAARLRAAESDEAALADRMAALAAQKREAEQGLAAEAAALGPMLPLLERLALYPNETLLALPTPPGQAVLGLMVLRGVTRTMQEQAASLRRRAGAIAALDGAMRREAPALEQARTLQQGAAAALDTELAAARADESAASLAAERAGRAAAAAATAVTTLKAAIAAIEAARQQAVARADRAAERRPARRAEAASLRAGLSAGPGLRRGQVQAPVAGALVRGFGAAGDAGPAQGVSYAPPPASRVVAPCGGSVLFAGLFRSYGRVVILDCGQGAVFVLAGMARLDVAAGARPRAADPVGVMPDWDPASGRARPTLYVELRRDGRAVDPLPFLGAAP